MRNLLATAMIAVAMILGATALETPQPQQDVAVFGRTLCPPPIQCGMHSRTRDVIL